VKVRIQDALSSGEHGTMTSEDIYALIMKVKESKDFQKLTLYYKGYIEGMIEQRRSTYWRERTTWMHINPATMIAYPAGHKDLDYSHITIDKWLHGHAWGKHTEAKPASELRWFTDPYLPENS
jgi:hypothetical protein